jgi:hypothetical protein
LDRAAPSQRIERAARLIAGLDVNVLADRNDLAEGEDFRVAVHAKCRAEAGCKIEEASLASITGLAQIKKEGELEKGLTYTVHIGDGVKALPGTVGSIAGWGGNFPDLAEPATYSRIILKYQLAGRAYSVREAVKYFDSNSTHADLVPLRILPALHWPSSRKRHQCFPRAASLSMCCCGFIRIRQSRRPCKSD